MTFIGCWSKCCQEQQWSWPGSSLAPYCTVSADVCVQCVSCTTVHMKLSYTHLTCNTSIKQMLASQSGHTSCVSSGLVCISLAINVQGMRVLWPLKGWTEWPLSRVTPGGFKCNQTCTQWPLPQSFLDDCASPGKSWLYCFGIANSPHSILLKTVSAKITIFTIYI